MVKLLINFQFTGLSSIHPSRIALISEFYQYLIELYLFPHFRWHQPEVGVSVCLSSLRKVPQQRTTQMKLQLFHVKNKQQ